MFGLKNFYLAAVRKRVTAAIGTAGLLVTGSIQAAEPGCSAPVASCPTIQGGGCCDKLFESTAERLRAVTDSCACSPSGCAAPETCCNPAQVFNGCGCNGGCDSGCGLFSEKLGDPWTVMSLFDDGCGGNCLKDKNWTVGGFTQYGYQSGPDGAFAGNGPFVNQKEYKRFALNQGYVFVGKTADGSKGMDWGFRFDALYGLDGNDAQSFGNNPGQWDFAASFNHGAGYEWALPQLYGEIAVDKLSVKVGHFYTPIGYEVVPSNGNFFLSRQLTFYNSEPFTHTGALATYKANDKLTAMGGYVYGMDTGFDQFNGSSSFLGGVTYVIDDKTSLIYAMMVGNLGWRGDGAINSWILTRKFSDKISTVHQFDVLNSNLGSNFNDQTSNTAGDSIGLINYAFYEFNSRLKAGVRQEWYKADGTSYYTYTAGVNIKPMANLIVRPEVRYMNSPGNQQTYVGPGFSDQLFNQTVFGVDAILTF